MPQIATQGTRHKAVQATADDEAKLSTHADKPQTTCLQAKHTTGESMTTYDQMNVLTWNVKNRVHYNLGCKQSDSRQGETVGHSVDKIQADRRVTGQTHDRTDFCLNLSYLSTLCTTAVETTKTGSRTGQALEALQMHPSTGQRLRSYLGAVPAK